MSYPYTVARALGGRAAAMSTSLAGRSSVPVASRAASAADRGLLGRVRITARGIQIALGVIWLVDGLLQFQSYMYTHGFVSDVLQSTAAGQPSWIGDPINTVAAFYGRDLSLWNTAAAEIQTLIGLGLIVSRRTVRPALAVSFAWSLVVWWLGEGFGLLTSNTEPSALMGAPGAVIIYALIGLAVWPRRSSSSDPGSLDAAINSRVASYAWSVLWLMSGLLWLLNVNRSRNAIHDMIAGMASGSPHWLASLQNSVASATAGHGEPIAIALAAISLIVAAGVWLPALRLAVLAAGVVVSLVYWVIGQSLGGPFWAGQATDVNAAPLFVLLAFVLIPSAGSTGAGSPIAAHNERAKTAASSAEKAAPTPVAR
jgi:hypothetical protein